MCVRIISTRLPGWFSTNCRLNAQSSTKYACRYLTCSSNTILRWNSDRLSTSSRTHLYLNPYCSTRQLIRKYDYSTLPKRDTFDKGIISEISTPRALQNEKSQKESDRKDEEISPLDSSKKLGLFARFKLMYKQYWYVLIPVHVITSIGWFAGFYYMSQSGVDIPAVLETLRVSETVIDKLRDSTMGHLAIAYLCYKIATPLRYTITLGGTTISIKYLEKYGYIKPMPSKSELIQMYEDKRADMARRKQERANEEK